MYIKKEIEFKNTGHINECWVCDLATLDLTHLLTMDQIGLFMKGYKNISDFNNGKQSCDVIHVLISGSDIELNGSIGYNNIPSLYKLLTTKKHLSFENNEEIPSYPDFFSGLIEG
jgi:hypothetical protein